MLKKQVASKGKKTPKLTSNQTEVLMLLKQEFLTPRQIAVRRGTSHQAVYKIISDLKKKGALSKHIAYVAKIPPPISMKGFKKHEIVTKLWRFHALHFVVKPYYFFPRYHKIRLEKGNYGINYREWVIKLQPDMIEVQLKKFEDFSSPDKWEATRKAEASFNRTLNELENKYGFHVWKEGKANIRLVNQDLARNPSEIADARDGDFLQLRGYDGKVYFQIDKSKGAEHEYTHPERALSDSEKIEPHLNDMLYNSPPTLSELMCVIHDMAKINKETASGLNSVVTLLKSQVPKEHKEKLERADYFG